jgi:hypothetical protein
METNLSLADAILMGSSVVKPKAGVQHEQHGEEQAGCALGMANIAAGAKYVNMTPEQRLYLQMSGENARSYGASAVWGNWVKKIVPRPCSCVERTMQEMYAMIRANSSQMLYCEQYLAFKLLDPKMPIQDIITHLFDYHVMADPATWTLEQLADWVRRVEGPAREEEKEQRLCEMRKLMEEDASKYWPVIYSGPMHRMMFGVDYGAAGSITLNPISQAESPMQKQGFQWSENCNAWIRELNKAEAALEAVLEPEKEESLR